MPRTLHTVDEIRTILDTVTAERPDHIDRRPNAGLTPRFIDHGQPACLVGVILARLGVSTGLLRALDRDGARLDEIEHPLRRRFTPEAWALLAYLQHGNDGATSWQEVRRRAFRPDPYWLRVYPKRAWPGPWCTSDNAITD